MNQRTLGKQRGKPKSDVLQYRVPKKPRGSLQHSVQKVASKEAFSKIVAFFKKRREKLIKAAQAKGVTTLGKQVRETTEKYVAMLDIIHEDAPLRQEFSKLYIFYLEK